MNLFMLLLSIGKAFIIISLLLLFGSIALAQSSGATAGAIVGNVKDSSGAVIEGAKITARQIETNFDRVTQVDSNGKYQLAQLPPGSYEVKAQAEGFTPQSEKFTLTIGTTALVEFILTVGASNDVIEVRGNNRFEEGNTESSTIIDRTRIDNLPINRRDFLDFSLTAPRVAIDRLPPQGVAATSGLSINGQIARFNNITIDGLDNNDIGSGSARSTFSQDAIQEFQVVSDSFSAEFGRALGGVINIVTRSGGNILHGDLFLFNRNDKIGARDPFSSSRLPFSQYQFGSTLSGPIKKDRAFFFTSFERLSIKQNNIVTISDEAVAAANRQGFALSNGAVPFSVGTTVLLTRVDLRLNNNDTFWLRYNGGFTYNGAFERFGGTIDQTNAAIQRLNDNSIASDNTYVNSRLNLINETRFLFSRRDQDILPPIDGPQVQLVLPAAQITFGRNILLPQIRDERSFQLVDNVTLMRGRNQIKFGGDFYYFYTGQGTNLPQVASGEAFFVPLDFAMLSGIPGLPTFTGLQAFDPASRTPAENAFLPLLSAQLPKFAPGFPANLPLNNLAFPEAYVQSFGDTRLNVQADFLSFFFQDDIKLLPNLLLKTGLRYDRDRVRFLPKNNGDFSPRLAISYHPGQWPKLQLSASYGIFFTAPPVGAGSIVQPYKSGALKEAVIPFPFSILAYNLPGHHFPVSDQVPADVNLIPQLSQVFTTQNDLRNSYAQQAKAGLDYFISNTTLLSVSYNYLRGIKLVGLRNINPVVHPIAGNSLASMLTGRVDPTQGSIMELESAFDSYYNALTISVNRRLSNQFSFLANYTFSKAIDDLDDTFFILSRNNSLKPGDERGLSNQDVRSRFVLSGTMALDDIKNRFLHNFQFSTIVTLESGAPYALRAGQDLNMDGDLNDRPPGVSRNSGIQPGFANIDLRITRSFPIKRDYSIQGFFEVFNLLNKVNINLFDATFSPDAEGNFNLPPKQGNRYILPPDRYRSAFAPRQIQLGFRLNF